MKSPLIHLSATATRCLLAAFILSAIIVGLAIYPDRYPESTERGSIALSEGSEATGTAVNAPSPTPNVDGGTPLAASTRKVPPLDDSAASGLEYARTKAFDSFRKQAQGTRLPHMEPALWDPAMFQFEQADGPNGGIAYKAVNPLNTFAVEIGNTGVTIADGGRYPFLISGEDAREDDHLQLRFNRYGSADAMIPVRNDQDPFEMATAQRLQRRHDSGVIEWWENKPEGLEHGYTVEKPLPEMGADGELRFELVIESRYSPVFDESHGQLLFMGADGERAMTYTNLRVTDANGRSLPARIEVGAWEPDAEGLNVVEVALLVDARAAAFPIEVDPTISSELVADLDAGILGSIPQIVVGDRLYFVAFTDETGFELWASDGTAESTRLVKDIAPGRDSSLINDFHVIGSKVLFQAWHPDYGRELWASDGTEAGTVLLKDIYAGSSSSGVYSIISYAGKWVFVANGFDGVTQIGAEPWITDGTPEGTTLLRDVRTGPGGSGANNFIEYNGDLLFGAFGTEEGAYVGYELWKTDGSSEGTVLLRDIYAGPNNGFPGIFFPYAGELYFQARGYDGVTDSGVELWKTDGTEAGTQLVKDYSTGSHSTSPWDFRELGGLLYFRGTLADDTINYGQELFRTDGTEAGTLFLGDLYAGPGTSYPQNRTFRDFFFEVGGIVYFMARGYDGTTETGDELYRTDGTPGGTFLLKDFFEGSGSSNPSQVTSFQGKLYFVNYSNDGTYTDREIWMTDGTVSGTEMLKDIYAPANSNAGIQELQVFNGRLIFRARGHDGTIDSGYELWTSDGTEAGTQMLKDISAGSGSSFPQSLTEHQGFLYFNANGFDGSTQTGRELWKTDGTSAGTQLVKDIWEGLGDSNPYRFTVFNNELYFVASGYDGTISSGQELWKSDGTEAGTILVKDIAPGSAGSGPNSFQIVGNQLLFNAYVWVDGVGYGTDLFKTDGTSAGTTAVFPGLLVSQRAETHSLVPIIADTRAYFFVSVPVAGPALYAMDIAGGPGAKVTDVAVRTDSYPNTFGSIAEVGDVIVFHPPNLTNYGSELWATDGTAEGTFLLRDIQPGAGSSNPQRFALLNGELYFIATGQDAGQYVGTELWKTDGTPEGTVLVRDIYPGPSSSSPQLYESISFNNELYFAANGVSNGTTTGIELWKTDGTSAGTQLVKDLYPGPNSSYPTRFKEFNGRLYFSAEGSDGNTFVGRELWRTDGTTGGTQLVKDIYLGSGDGIAYPGIEFNGALYFIANGYDGISETGRELWKTDGTPAGTLLVKDIWEGIGNSDPYDFTVFNNRLYFVASGYDGTTSSGQELWITDGTEAGTQLIKDISPGHHSSWPISLQVANGLLYFIANYRDDTTILGRELFRSDGTEAGTFMLADINQGSGSGTTDLSNAIEFNGRLYFVPTSYDGTDYDSEIWMTDGTVAGTQMLKNLTPSPGQSSGPQYLTVVNNVLYFSAVGVDGSGNVGRELWKSDGTEAGTGLVKDIYLGPSSSTPLWFTPISDLLFFTADGFDGIANTGREWWVVDPDTEEAVQVEDLFYGASSSNPIPFFASPTLNTLLYYANNGQHGNALRSLSLADTDGDGLRDFLDPCPQSALNNCQSVPGTMWTVGRNDWGQLHDGTTEMRVRPQAVEENVRSIDAGAGFTVWIDLEGTLWAVGMNDFGQLGDGTTTPRKEPFPVDVDVKAVAAGGSHTIYLKEDGTVWGMGRNDFGELGDGSGAHRYSPVWIASDVVFITAGAYHCMWISSDGTLYGTGYNAYGQLGIGNRTNQLSPVEIAVDIQSASAGGFHSLFIANDQTLHGMGHNTYGQVGAGADNLQLTPFQMASDVASASAGFYHSLFITTGGTLMAQGNNSEGELGDGTGTHQGTPVVIDTDVVQVDSTDRFSLYVKADQSLWATGSNAYGQIGNYTTRRQLSPVQIAGRVMEAACGSWHAVYLLAPDEGPDPDFDGDEIVDTIDNCPDHFNPGQADWDSNGTGDVCEPPRDIVLDFQLAAGDGNITTAGDGTHSGMRWSLSSAIDPERLQIGDRITGNIHFPDGEGLHFYDYGGGFYENSSGSGREPVFVNLISPDPSKPSTVDASMELLGVEGPVVTDYFERNGGIFHAGLFLQQRENVVEAGTGGFLTGFSFSFTLRGGDFVTLGSLYVEFMAEEIIQGPPVLAPVIIGELSAEGTFQEAFSYQVEAKYGPEVFSAAGLPNGLAIDPDSGLISGEPIETGSFNVFISAANAGGLDSQWLVLNVAKADAYVEIVEDVFSYDGLAKAVGVRTSPFGLPLILSYDGSTSAPSAPGIYDVVVTIDSLYYKGTASGRLVIWEEGVPVLDQELVPANTAGQAIVEDGQSVGQSFTAGLSGLITQVDIGGLEQSGGTPSEDLVFELQGTVNGLPDGFVLATASIPASDVPAAGAGFGTVVLDFNEVPIRVSRGDQLAIVLRSAAPAGGPAYLWNGESPGTYAGGAASVNGSLDEAVDRAFAVHITPLTDEVDEHHVPANGLGGLEVTQVHPVAQTFTVGTGGVLSRIDITGIKHHQGYPQGDLTFELQSVENQLPTGVVLAARTVPPEAVRGVSDGFGNLRFDINGFGIAVEPGQMFAIVLSTTASDDTGGTYAWNGENPGLYDGGATILAGALNLRDMAFRTFVDPPDNLPPSADAGMDQSIHVGTVVQLDGSGSFDDNTAAALLEFSWNIDSAPTGSIAQLDDALSPSPVITPDLSGNYVISLSVTDEQGLPSEPAFVLLSTNNLAPVPRIVVDPAFTVIGNGVSFDGSTSTDPEDEPLTYTWVLTDVPDGSSADLSANSGVAVGLYPDVPGTYRVSLVVADSIGPSDPVSAELIAADAEAYTQVVVMQSGNLIEALPVAEVTTEGNQNALNNFLRQVFEAIENEDSEDAVNKLEQAMERTDGCILRGAPDANGKGRDWITDCDTQIEVYTLLKAALDALLESP